MKGEIAEAMGRFSERVLAATDQLPTGDEDAAKTAARAVLSGLDLDFDEIEGLVNFAAFSIAADESADVPHACASGIYIGLVVAFLIAEQREKAPATK